jgi:Domain of unknown function (DUF4410)
MNRLIILLGLAVTGCSTGHVMTTQSAVSGTLPPPAHVVVTDFAIRPEQVKLDSGVSAQLIRSQGAQPESAQQEEAARATQAALAETLAARLASYGLPVERLPSTTAPPAGTLLVQGQIVSVDEGNRTRRTLIGLGAGKSSVAADAQLYYVADPARPQFLQAFTGSADSGRMPGAAETMGAGAAADRITTSAAASGATHAGAEVRRTGDEANADKLADALARQIATYAVSQAWIPASAIH